MATSVSDKLKLYVFPGLASLLGLLIWTTVNDIKDDISAVREDLKVLMAQSNVDKTRIDNLERLVYKRTASVPFKAPKLPQFMQVVALKPDEDGDLFKKS
jgi:hypothetical protein